MMAACHLVLDSILSKIWGGGLLWASLRRTACDVMEANVRVSSIDNFLVVPKRIGATLAHVILLYCVKIHSFTITCIVGIYLIFPVDI